MPVNGPLQSCRWSKSHRVILGRENGRPAARLLEINRFYMFEVILVVVSAAGLFSLGSSA